MQRTIRYLKVVLPSVQTRRRRCQTVTCRSTLRSLVRQARSQLVTSRRLPLSLDIRLPLSLQATTVVLAQSQVAPTRRWENRFHRRPKPQAHHVPALPQGLRQIAVLLLLPTKALRRLPHRPKERPYRFRLHHQAMHQQTPLTPDRHNVTTLTAVLLHVQIRTDNVRPHPLLTITVMTMLRIVRKSHQCRPRSHLAPRRPLQQVVPSRRLASLLCRNIWFLLALSQAIRQAWLLSP